jgi:hypothetical protein
MVTPSSRSFWAVPRLFRLGGAVCVAPGTRAFVGHGPRDSGFRWAWAEGLGLSLGMGPPAWRPGQRRVPGLRPWGIAHHPREPRQGRYPSLPRASARVPREPRQGRYPSLPRASARVGRERSELHPLRITSIDRPVVRIAVGTVVVVRGTPVVGAAVFCTVVAPHGVCGVFVITYGAESPL